MTDFSGRRFPFAACGDDVTIYEMTRILGPEAMHLGNHIIIDDFVFIDGRAGMTIGDYVHIAGFASVAGQGEVEFADFSFLSAGARLVTGSDAFDGSGLLGPTIPDDLRNVTRGRVVLERHAGLGTNAVALPNVTIGEGTVVGAGAVVTEDLPPWTICVGAPARPVRERPRDEVLAREAELRRREQAS